MAAFCGTCGKPIAADGKFCGSCGATNSATPAQTAPAPPVAAAATGTSALKIVLIVLVLGGGVLLAAGVGAYYVGRHKVAQWQKDNGITAALPASKGGHRSSSSETGSAFLTKEEVSEIIGRPVTSIERQSKWHALYKTDTPGFEAGIEIEPKDDVADATQDVDAARTVTRNAFGGKADTVAGLGDDALYGAFNTLYVRKDNVVVQITPPMLQMVAQGEQAKKMFAQPLGSPEQVKELEKLKDTMKGDPVAGSLAQPDAVSGAAGIIHGAAKDRGDEYETKARLMARQMAEKVLSKI